MNVRTIVVIAWATTIDVLSAFLVTFATPYIQNTPGAGLGARVGFVFMGAAVLALIYFMLFLPELKGRSLEEVDELFEVSRVCVTLNSKFETPTFP